jgi:Holliday junction resolvasome RuvABC endonuclease subunit
MIPVLAVDPSLNATGWATITPTPSGGHQHHHGLIRPRTRIGNRWHKLTDPNRMLHTAAHIRNTAQVHAALIVAIEEPAYTRTSSSNDRIYGLHWIIRATLHAANIPYITVPSTTIKAYATGYGHAPKRTSPVRGTDRDGMVDTARTDLHYPGWDDNIADALWLHALTSDALGHGYAPDLADPKAADKRAAAIAAVIPHLPRNGVLT